MIKPAEVVDIKNIKTERGKEIFYAKFGNLIHFGIHEEKHQAFENFKLSSNIERNNIYGPSDCVVPG